MPKGISSLKILHILDHSLPLHSGYAFRSQNIFRAQQKRGWQPVALTSSKHEESWRGQWDKEEEIDGICYYRTGSISHFPLPIESERRLMTALNKRIQEVLKIEKPDLLHAHSPVLNAIPALRSGRKSRIPVVYEIRAFWEDAAVDHGTYKENSWKYRLAKSVETWVCRQVDQVAVLCNGLKKDLIVRGIPPDKLRTVFNGVDLDNFNACEPDAEYEKAWQLSGKKVIGFIGSFYRYEGIDLLVDAFTQIAKSRSNAVLLLVGGGEMENELKTKVQLLDLGKRVLMPGRIPHDRIPGVYALVDILAYPRYSMRLTELVTPLKPLEAMAMGKVVVASDIGGHKELITPGQTGVLFPAGNSSALADVLERLLSDQELRRTLERQGMSWVHQEHSWDKTTSVYSEIYSKALEKTISRP